MSRLTRRGLLATTLASVAFAGCSRADPAGNPAPGPTPPSTPTEGTPVPGELATHDPADRILPGTDLFLTDDGATVAALAPGHVATFDAAAGTVLARVAVEVANHPSSQPWSLVGSTAVTAAAAAEVTAVVTDLGTGDAVPVRISAADGSPLGLLGVAISPDGRFVVLDCGDGPLRVIAADSGSPVAEFTPAGDDVAPSLSHAPDGRLVLSSGATQCPLQFWAPDGSELLDVVDAVEQPYHHLQFSDAGTCFLLRELDEAGNWAAEFRDAVSYEELASYPLPVAGTVFSFSPDGSRLAWTAGWGPTTEAAVIHVMDVATGEVTELTGHEAKGQSLLHSPDSTVLYSASSREGIMAWDPVAGTRRGTFELP